MPSLVNVAPRLAGAALVLVAVGFAARADDEKQPEEKIVPKFAPKNELAKLPAAFSKKAPENLEDLKEIQEQLAKAYEKVKPSVVCLKFGNVVGSGVIVTEDGYIMTAGHVSATPNRPVSVIFPDGKTVKGITLGGNHGIDSGMAKITEAGKWPAAEIGDSSKLKVGQWCFVCSHPGGFKQGRTPPVRLGRITFMNQYTINTDCILVGGDSGGPLFDMYGRVIGINSRIGDRINQNMHVPANPFVDNWDKLAKGEVYGGRLFGGGGPPQLAKGAVFLGVQASFTDQECVVQEVVTGSPAEKAGVKAKDIIVKFDGKEIGAGEVLSKLVRAHKAGDTVPVEIRRGDAMLTLKVTLAKR